MSSHYSWWIVSYDQVADENLQNLGLETCTTGKDTLQNADKEMAQRRRNKHAIQRHLGHAMAEVVAVLADIVGDPGREEFLQGGEQAGSQHFGAQGVGLELAQVELSCQFLSLCLFIYCLVRCCVVRTAIYPVWVLPPVKRSPMRWASSLVSWRTDRAASSGNFSWNLTDMTGDGSGWE